MEHVELFPFNCVKVALFLWRWGGIQMHLVKICIQTCKTQDGCHHYSILSDWLLEFQWHVNAY